MGEVGITIAVTNFSDSFHIDDEGMRFSETSALIITTRRHIQEDGILHSNRREHLKPYMALTGLAL
jgi:hypothetical protein